MPFRSNKRSSRTLSANAYGRCSFRIDRGQGMKTILGFCTMLWATASIATFPARGDELTSQQSEFFETKIRPIFVDHCYECHSADSEELEGGLMLDSKWGWQTGGDSGPAVVPGKPEESLLIGAIRYEDDIVSAMPPKSKLSDLQIGLLEQWVAMGAPDPRPKTERTSESMVETFDLEKRFAEHWSWRPITSPAIPEVQDKSWPRSEIDHFILARIEAARLQPAVEADRRTWLRRVYFDVIGLPPTREQTQQFLDNTNPDAYQTVVQQLLDSPHFGEKWARHWMDLVRYAETYGHEFDYPIDHANEYRDYLIRALNADVPYDQFVREHIAGDLLPQPRQHPDEQFNESIIATGFWYLHEATHAPTDVLGNEADIIDNQIDVFGKAFLGLTVACARCHDHKFDAIGTADYYALSAYIQSSCRQQYPLDPGRRIENATNQIASLRKQAVAALRESKLDAEPIRPRPYFEAASRLLIRSFESSATPSTGDVVLEDFESGYQNWTVTGKAFGDKPATEPTKPQQPFVGSAGRGTATSYNGSDRRKGALTSKPFKISLPYINLRVGGGKTGVGVELRIDDKVVRSASGENREDLIQHAWDVNEFIGKEATLRIFDDNAGGWGHVNVDQIVASHHPANRDGSLGKPPTEWIVAEAAEHDLERDRLERWIDVLTSVDTSADPTDASALLAMAIKEPGRLTEIIRRWESEQRSADEFRQQSKLFADFNSSELPAGWSTSGRAFQPTGDSFALSVDGAPHSLPGTIDSSLLGKKTTGILRSPTFEITANQIHMRMRSTANVTINVVIDNYQMAPFNGLLFNGTFIKDGGSDTGGKWQWKSFGGDLKKYIGHKAYLEFVDQGDAYLAIDEIRFSDHGPPRESVDELATNLKDGADSLDPLWMNALTDLRLGRDNSFLQWLITNKLVSIDDLSPAAAGFLNQAGEIARSLPHPRYAIAMAEGTKENAHIYIRGSHTSPGKEVPPRFLQALGGDEGNRLDLANRVASGDNPLTARVIVNRVWHHLFGRGIVPTVDDFGPQGQPPSHIELLDWMANDFVNNGWSLKKLIGEIVLSQTYRQSSVVHPDIDLQQLSTIDPTNTLLHRMRIRRLPAESIRDGILAVSGRLDPKQFGASVATHRTPFMTGRGARGSGPLDGDGRRSVYLSVYRNFLNPFMLTFDMPSPFGPQGGRSTSNVPAQALTLMNDPFVVQQANLWAEKALADSSLSQQQRIVMMVEQAHGETPTDEQLAAFQQFLQLQGEEYGTIDQRAWSDLAHVLWNMKSFYFLK